MKKLLTAVSLFLSIALSAQTVEAYFQKIRNDAAALTAFFSAMPKGGDLHHHFSGSVYGETFLETAVAKGFFVNVRTLQIAETKPDDGLEWVQLSSVKTEKGYETIREKLLQFWSVKDYDGAEPAAAHFFNAFDRFGPAVGYATADGLLEIKARAKAEKVSYIETSLSGVRCKIPFQNANALTDRLLAFGKACGAAGLRSLLDSLWQTAKDSNDACVEGFQKNLQALHNSLNLDDSAFTIRFQSAVNRNQPPLSFFVNLTAAFETANSHPLVVGVNILAPEHYETSMRDYWLHMQMFGFLRAKYGGVKCSLHAGELALGLVKPEDLTWHIGEAVHTAKADRIGHGVDLPYERNLAALLDSMAARKVAVEINLTSNEFILGVKDDRHPLLLYKTGGVPVVISTDDAGILRTGLTEQYVLLAKRYPSVSYADIKRFVFNSIDRSFINQDSVKEKLQERLNADFRKFEKDILAAQKR